MKSLVWLTEQVLLDCGTRCGVDPTRDLQTITSRVKTEGDSFLTITLPTFCKGFERALEERRIAASMFPAFRQRRGSPAFLRGFLAKIFDTDRTLRTNACPDCIAAIRQICRLHAKVLLPCTSKREWNAEQAFVRCENELSQLVIPEDLLNDFGRVSGVIFSDLLRGVPYGAPYDELKPRHGPGTTQEKILGNSKYRLKTWHTRLDEEFPFTEFGCASVRNLGEDDCPLERVKFVEPADEQPVRVVFVPKTLKTPRVIAIEPVCMQYMQQALSQFLVSRVERGYYTAGRVNSLTKV